MILTEHHDQIFEIILNRPEKGNAMNMVLMKELEAAIDTAEKTEGLRVVIVRGEGTGFSSGIDLMDFNSLVEDFGSHWSDNLFPTTAFMQGIFNKFERSTYPIISLLHGYCLGMAFEFALACDFRIAQEGTRMGLPETRLGLIPDVGGSTRLTRLVGQGRAKELIMTGRYFKTDYAERWGIVNQVATSHDDLLKRGYALANELIAAAPLAVSYAKKVIDGIADIDRGLQLEAWAQSVLMRTEDFQHGAQSMMLRQTPEWKGR